MQDAKHKDALRTIGEVADDVGVATHVLRFWENKFSQINPQKRRGRRYYSVEDISTIKTIKELLYQQGYTIRGVDKFLKNAKKQQVTPKIATQIADIFEMDLFGNIVVKNEDEVKTTSEFGPVEIAKLKEIYRGLCSSRNRLNNLAS